MNPIAVNPVGTSIPKLGASFVLNDVTDDDESRLFALLVAVRQVDSQKEGASAPLTEGEISLIKDVMKRKDKKFSIGAFVQLLGSVVFPLIQVLTIYVLAFK